MVFIQHVTAIQLIKNLRLITSFVVCFPRQLHSLNLFSHSISFTAILIACSHQWLGQPSPVFNFSSTPCICYMSNPSHFPSLTHPNSIRLRLNYEALQYIQGVPYVKIYRYNPKHLCPKLNSYGDNGQRKVRSSGGSTHCTCQLTSLIDVCP
jgi:hypothetical protein